MMVSEYKDKRTLSKKFVNTKGQTGQRVRREYFCRCFLIGLIIFAEMSAYLCYNTLTVIAEQGY